MAEKFPVFLSTGRAEVSKIAQRKRKPTNSACVPRISACEPLCAVLRRIPSIEALKGMLNKILSATLEILSRHTPVEPGNPYTRLDFDSRQMDLLVHQLVFDVLFNKYIKESPLMTRNGYAAHISEIVYCNDNQRIDRIPAIERNLARGMKDHYNTMKYSELREQLKMLGVDSDK